MLYRDPTPRGYRGATIGFVEGALAGAALGTACLLLSGAAPGSRTAPLLSSCALTGGLVLGLGRGISGRMLGAGLGCLLGLAAWLTVRTLVPANGPFPRANAPGAANPPFALSGPTLDGHHLDLADYRGKVVLINFWATWCVPCVNELPGVLEAYDRYHHRGFEVVAVSLDADRGRLDAFVRERHLPWPQVFFDDPGKRGWVSPVARQNQVNSIPATFLIDREGRLLAAGLHGQDLLDEVGEQFDPDVRRTVIDVGWALLAGALLGALAQRQYGGRIGTVPAT